MNLADKRVQVMAGVVVAAFGFIVSFLTISTTFGIGFQTTFLLAVIAGLVGWIFADQIVRRKSPKPVPEQVVQTGAGGIGCLNCGYWTIFAPPDSVHIIAKLEPCTYGDSKLMNWTCKNCRKANVTYWDTHHPLFGTAQVG